MRPSRRQRKLIIPVLPARRFLERVAMHITKNYLAELGVFDPQTKVPLILGAARVGVGVWGRMLLAAGGAALSLAAGAASNRTLRNLRHHPASPQPRASAPPAGIWGGKGQGKSFQTELCFKKLG